MSQNKVLSCLIIGVCSRDLINFRGSLMVAMIASGARVYAAASGRNKDIEDKLCLMGVEYFPLSMTRAGLNPFKEAAAFCELVRLIRHIKPDMILSYTIKPNIYGGIAASWCGVKAVFPMIEGLGHVFMSPDSMRHFFSALVARLLYRLGLLFSQKVFFLNPDDLKQFVNEHYVSASKAVLLDGIGVDLNYYANATVPFGKGSVRFLMVARLLKGKGVREYIEAARSVKARRTKVEFWLAGDLDENPDSVTRQELAVWQAEGLVNYAGWVKDVRPLLRSCHVFILPSYYREGVPRTTLEAMATGRAIITTDCPGCRETVDHGRNGIMVAPKDHRALAEAIELFLDNPELAGVMGVASRIYAEQRFNVHKVNSMILKAMNLL